MRNIINSKNLPVVSTVGAFANAEAKGGYHVIF